EECDDAKLQLLMAEIELRAAVELAKLGRAP
ncbi:MAG: flagellar assembly protein FliX, partial [Alphaproteobacteria bacterium]